MSTKSNRRRMASVVLILSLLTTNAFAGNRSRTRRNFILCAAALTLGASAVGGWLFAPNLSEMPIFLTSDGKETKTADPKAAAQELRDLLTARGGAMRIRVIDASGDQPTLRLYDKTRIQRTVADRIKDAIQKKNPHVDGREIGVGEPGMVIRVHYLELLLQPSGTIRLAVGGLTWRLESSSVYEAEEVLSGDPHSMEFGPHVENDPQAVATFRAGFLLRFDAKARAFVVPHAKCFMKVDARPWINEEDFAELRDIRTEEVR